jgi:hypothetical protein
MKTMLRIAVLAAIWCLMSLPAFAQDFTELVDILRGAQILAQNDENTYLGKLVNKYDSQSIFNEYGEYGSKYSSGSIWNEYGSFGGKYSSDSPFNKYTSTPPMIIKKGKVIGYLTTNKNIEGNISPNLLKAIEDEF